MYRIGIDLGGTNIAVGVVNEQYVIVSHTSVPTLAHRSPEAVVSDMGDAVQAALDQAGLAIGDCASIGVGSPGTCDSERGVVVRAYNLGWHEVPVCDMLTASPPVSATTPTVPPWPSSWPEPAWVAGTWCSSP